MTIKCVIVDDDPFIRSELEELLVKNKVVDIDQLKSFGDPKIGLDYLQLHKPDLLFLDILMPGMSGFDLLDNMKSTDFEVIFITSYNQYAIRAIKYSALDYLLKPLKKKELNLALDRFIKRTEKMQMNTRISNLRHNLMAENDAELQLVLSSKQGEHRFPVNEIVRCEADSNYTMIYLKGDRKYLASKTLSDIEEMLVESPFLRVHKSHMVNADFIEHLSRQNALILSNKSEIPVSRRRVVEVRNYLLNRRTS